MRVSHVVIRGIPCSQAPIKQPPAATRASRPIRVNLWPHTWLEDPKNCCGSSTNGDRTEVGVMGEAFTTAMKCSVTNHNLGWRSTSPPLGESPPRAAILGADSQELRLLLGCGLGGASSSQWPSPLNRVVLDFQCLVRTFVADLMFDRVSFDGLR